MESQFNRFDKVIIHKAGGAYESDRVGQITLTKKTVGYFSIRDGASYNTTISGSFNLRSGLCKGDFEGYKVIPYSEEIINKVATAKAKFRELKSIIHECNLNNLTLDQLELITSVINKLN